MTKTYNIQFKPNVRYPNIQSNIDVNEDHLFSLNNLKNRIQEQILEFYLGHPLFDNNINGDIDDRLDRLRRKARYIVKFPCEGNESLSRDKYGPTLDDKDCINGEFEIINSLRNVPREKAFLPDIFAGSEDIIKKPDVTVEFEEVFQRSYYIAYNFSIKIQLEIKCNNKKIALITLPGFYTTIDRPGSIKTATFIVSSSEKTKQWSKVHTKFVYGINKKTTLVRVPTGTSNAANRPLYKWIPNGNDPSFDSLLYNNPYDSYEPKLITDYEASTVETGDKTIIPDNSYPDQPLLEDLAKNINNLIYKFLSLRLKQLQHTLKDEITDISYTSNDPSYKLALDVLDRCDAEIKVSSFEIDTVKPKANYDGLFLRLNILQDPFDKHKFPIIATEKDIFKQFPNKSHLK